MAPHASGQTNLVQNGGFENGLEHWTASSSEVHNEMVAGAGLYWLGLNQTASQEISTVPGRNYTLKFAAGPTDNIRVKWGNEPAVEVTMNHTGAWAYTWWFTNLSFTATNTTTSLQFESVSGTPHLDAVEVRWAEEPPAIVVPIASRSTFVTGAASFNVSATGADPLEYQWFRHHLPIAGGTNRVLLLTNVQTSGAGEYWVKVKNPYGSVSSLKADLLVQELPTIPLIVSQPKSQSVLSGYMAEFHTVAFSASPMFYQWQFNGTNLPHATNSSLTISPTETTNSGQYSVLVSNRYGTAQSFSAALEVSPATVTGGYVYVVNRNVAMGINSPVFDCDGTTRLQGSNYVVQIYSGATPDILHAVGDVSYFGSSYRTGYFYAITRCIPDVPARQTAYIQLRAWDRREGMTYEEAKARGGRTGKSNTLPVVLGDALQIPETYGFRSFSLDAGASPLATAKIERGPHVPFKNQEWLLIGDPGYQYAVEELTPPKAWTPLTVLTNNTGVVSFVDPTPQSSSVRFYRARIIEP